MSCGSEINNLTKTVINDGYKRKDYRDITNFSFKTIQKF